MDLPHKNELARFGEPEENTWILEKDIHIWKFPAIQLTSSVLSASENESAGRYRFEGDRNRFSVGRYGLRILLSKYLSLNAAEISFSEKAGMKPVIGNPSSKIHFNISHSGDWVLIAFATEELGIDIEITKKRFGFQDLLTDHFSPEEKESVLSAPDPAAVFYYLWTRKEALTKAWGTGLRENLKDLAVLNKNSGFESNHRIWKLVSFYLTADYPAAIAFPESLNNLYFFNGSSLLTLF